ncbi:Trichothecene C-15 hydroxylase [Paramyrothecium foliicola]|nr:Trichothecene C-15 hydroxylase [Paramyrothecium foliicola]
MMANPLILQLFLYGVITVIYNLFLHPLRRFPGPKLWAATPLPAALNGIRGMPHTKILELHKRYGDIVRLGPNELAFSHENAWKDIAGHLKRGQEENGKDFDLLGNDSVISAPREHHGPMRRSLSHGFSARTMAAQQPIIDEYVNLLIQRFREHGEDGAKAVDVTKWYEWATFDIIGDLCFGKSFDCLKMSSSHPWVESLFDALRIIPFLTALKALPFYSICRPVYFALFMPKDVAEKRRLTEEFSTERLNERLALKGERPDFVDAMIKNTAEYTMTPHVMSKNINVLTTAGSETTATTLTGATYLLGTHPEVLAKLNAEVRSAFKSDAEIDVNSVQNLSYMLAVLKESMRVYPAVAISLPRRAPPGGAQVAGEHIPAGTTLGIWQYALYHSPSKFLDPDSFIPERWLDDERFKDDCKDLHQPFSLAYMEMRLILARIILNFDIELALQSRDWMKDQKVCFFWKKPPLWVYLKPRQL